ncbi:MULTISPECIES: hypothetical protein [Prochlorococcus]|nr:MULTISPECIES: hypothetical protein [Prochlorococcus]KGG14127.1 hypothetical protein EV05_0016 [Prochlorococcus sp. MIT 0601]
MNQILHSISHPLEGCAYLVYIGLFIRWKFPETWNKFVERLLVKKLPRKQ